VPRPEGKHEYTTPEEYNKLIIERSIISEGEGEDNFSKLEDLESLGRLSNRESEVEDNLSDKERVI
jgi:hypothetical protein